jgi:Flp pilus assembly protein TadD
LNPNDDMAHNNLGVALGKKGELDGAIAEYREVLHLNPKDEDAHNNLGVALGKNGVLDAEIAEEREALRLNLNYVAAHSNLGAALKEKGDLDGAIAECREAIRLNPKDEDAGLAQTWFSMSAFSEIAPCNSPRGRRHPTTRVCANPSG